VTRQGYDTLSFSPQWWLSPIPLAPYYTGTRKPDFGQFYTFRLQTPGILHRFVIKVTEIKPLPFSPNAILPNVPQLRCNFNAATIQACDQVSCVFQLNPTTPVIYAIAAVGPYWKYRRYTMDPTVNDTSTSDDIVAELNTVASVLHWEAIFGDLQTVYQDFPMLV
jgi:hypothetical protein